MRIIAENEVAHAGIGVDVGVNGLNQLIKADTALEKFHSLAERLHDNIMTITPHIENNDEVSRFYNDVRKLHHTKANVDFTSNGAQKIQDEIEQFRHRIEKSVDFKLLNVDPVNHEMEVLSRPEHKDIRFNVDTGEIDNVRNTVSHANDGVDRFRNSLTSVGRTGNSSFSGLRHGAENARRSSVKLADSGRRIHGVFSGAFLGNAFNNVFSTFTTHAESAIKSGFKLVQVGDEAKEAWRHIGLNNANANDMVKQMDTLRDSAGMDEQSIQQMQKAFYTFTGSAPKARTLVNEVTDFGKASGESNQEIARMGTMLPRMLSAGKIRGQMFNRTFGQSGKLVNALAKASGHSASSFRQLVDSGKLTSQQLQQYMWKASKGSSAALKEYTHTFGGQMTAIKGMWTGAKEQFSHPFVNQLTRSLNQTEKSAGGLDHVQKSVEKISASLGRKFGNQVGKAIGWIVKNQRPLMKTGNALARIIKEMFSGAWKEFSSVLTLIGGHAGKSSGSLNGVANALTNISKHTTAMRILGKVMLTTFAIAKIRQFKRAVFGAGKSMGSLRKVTYALIHPQETLLKLQKSWETVQSVWTAIIGPVKAFWAAEKAGVGIQTALDAAMDANPIGAVVVAITAAVGAVTALVIGLRHLYVHCAPARHAMQAIGRAGVMAFKAITWPERMVIKLLGGIIKGVWNATAGLRHKMASGFDVVKHHADNFYHSSMNGANRLGNKTGNWIAGNGFRYRRNQASNLKAVKRAHASIDRYRRNSSGKFKAYISKDGRIYRKYHRGTTRISESTYKQRELARHHYYEKYEASLKKYESDYKHYEDKRSSLSRRYGKLRAMYSERSLKLIEKRFNSLRKTVVKYAREMYRDTQRIFRKIGTGAGRQFRNIYRSVRKYLKMSNREAKVDFKAIYQTSRRFLDGSIKRYVNELRYRYKRQRYYDKQLVKQSKATAKAMYRLPLGWIHRETKDLIANWRRQRRSYVTHNVRMSHAELTHLRTMKDHLDHFSDDFRKLMSDLEDEIYSKWTKFWNKMHNAAGHGINEVQSPLNSGAEHINSFVRAFGESTSPMHEMPSVSYSTGTGFRRPITQMVNATLNDGIDSPETNHQETVIHPDGDVEFPKGQNVQELLEPGTEVLNATETKLMSEMANVAPHVHYSTGTSDLKHVINNHDLTNDFNSALSNQFSNSDSSVSNVDNSVANESMTSAPAMAHQIVEPIMKPIVNVTPQVHLNTGTGDLSRIINNSETSNTNGGSVIDNRNDNRSISRSIEHIVNSSHNVPNVHLAAGTGLFGNLFGQMSSWIKTALNGNGSGMNYETIYNQAKGSGDHKLLHILQKVLGHSEQVLAGFMGSAPSGYHGALSDITKGIYGQTSTQIDSWWKALMNLTNQALNNGGSSSAMLNFAEKNFSGIPYSMGGESHAAADCSGAVDMIARHFGVDLPRTTTGMENDPSQLQYVGKDESRARAGDLVLFGHGNGAAGHVGIYTGRPDEMWNETPPRSRVSRISDAESVVSLAGFYRLKKLANDNNSSLSFKGANSGLMKFVKHQENPMFKWIAKHLAPLLDPNPGGSGVARWRPYIERAAQQMHVHLTTSGLDKILSNIRHESGGDPTVTQHGYVDQNTYTHPAQGLVQFIPPTFNHYAVAGHHNIKSGYDQLLALFNDSSWYSDIAPGGGWSPSGSRRLATGGHLNAGEVATVGEQGEELFKPDTNGTVIPHDTTKRILSSTTNNSRKPVININQKPTYVIHTGDTHKIVRAIDRHQSINNDNLMEKLNRLCGGSDDGGLLV